MRCAVGARCCGHARRGVRTVLRSTRTVARGTHAYAFCVSAETLTLALSLANASTKRMYDTRCSTLTVEAKLGMPLLRAAN